MVAYGSFALDQHTPKWPGSSSHAACPEGLRALIFAVPAFSQGPAFGLSFRALSWGFEVYTPMPEDAALDLLRSTAEKTPQLVTGFLASSCFVHLRYKDTARIPTSR